ncbi:MAG: von Willebrand factor type [Dehalococcoidia bacterium]|nr:von Willebrand factor type [Dehalococcoidia bacterium]
MILAIGRPTAEVRLPSQEGTIILAMDVSVSMLADDVKPNRLEAAKKAALAFVDAQPANVRIGVVAFGNSAGVAQSPTQDKKAVTRAIEGLVPQRGTAIGRGTLASLAAIYGQSAAPQGTPSPSEPFGSPALPPITETVPVGSYASALIVLLTDGQNNSGPPPMDVIDEASRRGVRVYTVGLGRTPSNRWRRRREHSTSALVARPISRRFTRTWGRVWCSGLNAVN